MLFRKISIRCAPRWDPRIRVEHVFALLALAHDHLFVREDGNLYRADRGLKMTSTVTDCMRGWLVGHHEITMESSPLGDLKGASVNLCRFNSNLRILELMSRETKSCQNYLLIHKDAV